MPPTEAGFDGELGREPHPKPYLKSALDNRAPFTSTLPVTVPVALRPARTSKRVVLPAAYAHAEGGIVITPQQFTSPSMRRGIRGRSPAAEDKHGANATLSLCLSLSHGTHLLSLP